MVVNLLPSWDITNEIQLKLAFKRYFEVRWTVFGYIIDLKTLPIFITFYSCLLEWPKYNENLQGYNACFQKEWPLAINLIQLFDLVVYKTWTSTHAARCWNPRTKNVTIKNIFDLEQNTSQSSSCSIVRTYKATCIRRRQKGDCWTHYNIF